MLAEWTISGKVTFLWEKVVMGRYSADTSLVLTRYFQTDSLEVHSKERLKLQLGEILSLGLLIWGLAQVIHLGPIFYFNTSLV